MVTALLFVFATAWVVFGTVLCRALLPWIRVRARMARLANARRWDLVASPGRVASGSGGAGGPGGPVRAIRTVLASAARRAGRPFAHRRRRDPLDETLCDLLMTLSGALRAGHSFAQALHLAARDLSGPVAQELRRMEAEMALGISLEEALRAVGERIGSEDFDLVVTAVLIQRQVGGNLAEVLDRIAETVRDRIRLRREVRALTSQGRLSATIFMVLPTAVALLLFSLNPGYLRVLWTTPTGRGLLALAVAGQALGFIVIRRIVAVNL
ncbi:type II secretion system F family protein [Alicyclobacillus sp.]|uniref:type II secretion system F family protein n=1 Tax=Alicyclobacillus sp. TaxID=61169 RepID=UPI0025BB2891|nr:type II secretion system F family protein [Alicyclobacillus sp.]MCL6517841.1 type II secretion system F family protein [Alicyclobacillus sp.]